MTAISLQLFNLHSAAIFISDNDLQQTGKQYAL